MEKQLVEKAATQEEKVTAFPRASLRCEGGDMLKIWALRPITPITMSVRMPPNPVPRQPPSFVFPILQTNQ